MSPKPHYFRIGVLVILAVALIVIAVILFGAGLFTRNEMRFESYFAESITGLTVGAVLEFRCVRIGQVESIGFVDSVYELPEEKGGISRYSSYVRVVSAVSRSKLPASASGQIETVLSQMIARGLRVRITSNILTGQAYLEANYLDPNVF